MPPSSRIPPLLQPHTRLPKDDSIILVTSTLGASANWLMVRFLCEALHQDPATKNADDGLQEDVSVVLVSWMRDWDFWKNEARKGGGLDLERLRRDKKLAFVDGLSKMFLPEVAAEGKAQTGTPAGMAARPVGLNQMGAPPGRTPQSVLPVRGPPQGVLPARGPPGRIPNPRAPPPAAAPPAPVANPTPAAAPQTSASASSTFYMTSPELKEFQRVVENAIRHVESSPSQRKPLLILDMPSFMLASNPDMHFYALTGAIVHLHSLTSHVLVHLPADDALIALSTPPQPLEVSGHNFLVQTAHMSSRVLSCRVLDTGVAKDVSGVLRVTESAPPLRLPLRRAGDAHVEERHNRELLYLVKGDGSVKMFERGAGGDI